MIRFTAAECTALVGMGYTVVQNDDEESYATCAQATSGGEYWEKKVRDADGLGGFSSFYPHYFMRVAKKKGHYVWFAAPRLKCLNAKDAEFMGVFSLLNRHTLEALIDVIWDMEENPIPERHDFQIQRIPTFTLKH